MGPAVGCLIVRRASGFERRKMPQSMYIKLGGERRYEESCAVHSLLCYS